MSTGEPQPPPAAEAIPAVSAEQFPALHRAIASGVFHDDDEIEVELEFGLERLLDGVAVLITRIGPSRRATTVSAR